MCSSGYKLNEKILSKSRISVSAERESAGGKSLLKNERIWFVRAFGEKNNDISGGCPQKILPPPLLSSISTKRYILFISVEKK